MVREPRKVGRLIVAALDPREDAGKQVLFCSWEAFDVSDSGAPPALARFLAEEGEENGGDVGHAAANHSRRASMWFRQVSHPAYFRLMNARGLTWHRQRRAIGGGRRKSASTHAMARPFGACATEVLRRLRFGWGSRKRREAFESRKKSLCGW